MSELQDAVELTRLLGQLPTPTDCPRLGGDRHQTTAWLTTIDRLGDSNVSAALGAWVAQEAYIAIAAYVLESERVYRERMQALPAWQRWIKYFPGVVANVKMREWWLTRNWGL